MLQSRSGLPLPEKQAMNADFGKSLTGWEEQDSE
ncbi:MAG: hypothetical protein K0S86_3333 [Geminicoccaceae bacterium]|nr:hypothetical protein [Geminicoccaceae bacterium]